MREKTGHCGEVDLYFINKKNKYIWDENIQMFRKLNNIDQSLNQTDFHKMHGLNPSDVKERMRVSFFSVLPSSLLTFQFVDFRREHHKDQCSACPPSHYTRGRNPPQPHKFLISLQYCQGLNPFFLFQAYTVILWTLQWYWKFALIIAVTSVITVTLSVWEARRVSSRYLVMKCKYLLTVTVSVQQNRNLRDTMKSESKMRVVRNNRGTHTATHRHIAIMLRVCFIISNIIEY